MRALALLLALAAVVSAASVAGAAGGAERARVARVVDGDTIELTGGTRVRLLQVDAPEPGSGECYSRAAARELRRLLPAGAAVVLERDARLDDVDAYGRLLRYVWRDGRNVNLELVRRGGATVWLYRGERGRHAGALLAAARAARAARRGLWGACRTVWDPSGPAVTGGDGAAASPPAPARDRCDPSYPDVCIPPPPPDLDCADVRHRDFRVLPPDPHRFDGRDDDGLGCET